MYNKVIMVGNLTRDIELNYTQGGTAIAKTAIATSRKYTSNGEKREEVCFVDITFFGRSGEVANQYLRKGSKILVEGRLNFDQWTDNNGQKRSKHSVSVETMQMLDSRSDNQSGGNSYQAPQNNQAQQPQNSYQAPAQQQAQSYQAPAKQEYQAPQQQQQYQAQQMPKVDDVPVIDIDENEIPF
jgi:single-strand DNA-binding protein